MEDIDGGLHPAVDGQSLDEDKDERKVAQSFIASKPDFIPIDSELWQIVSAEMLALSCLASVNKDLGHLIWYHNVMFHESYKHTKFYRNQKYPCRSTYTFHEFHIFYYYLIWFGLVGWFSG